MRSRPLPFRALFAASLYALLGLSGAGCSGRACTQDSDCAGMGLDYTCLPASGGGGSCQLTFVRGSVVEPDAGVPAASVIELNGILAEPGVPLRISPIPVVTSPKFYIRKSSGNEPLCYYGVFVSDPAQAGGPNDGLLLVSLGNMDAINSDASLGGPSRSSCPHPEQYPAGVGGGIPDDIQVGDTVSAIGQLAPYCDYYDTSAGQCAADEFPEFQVDPSIESDYGVTIVGHAEPPAPLVVDPAAISDQSATAIQYAGELVQVHDVTISNPSAGYGDMILDPGQLWVSPLTNSVTIPAEQNLAIASLTGELHYQFQHWLIRPRTQSDLCLQAPCP